jgi:glutaredoxin
VLRAVSGEMTWPQVFVGGTRIGGADAVEAHFGPLAEGDVKPAAA